MELNTYKCDKCGAVKETGQAGWYLIWDDSANVALPSGPFVESANNGPRDKVPQVYINNVFHIAFWDPQAAQGTKVNHMCSAKCVNFMVARMLDIAVEK